MSERLFRNVLVAGAVTAGSLAVGVSPAEAWESKGEAVTYCVPDEKYGKAAGKLIFQNLEAPNSELNMNVTVTLDGSVEPVVIFADVEPGESVDDELELGSAPYAGNSGIMLQSWADQKRFGTETEKIAITLNPVDTCSTPVVPPVTPEVPNVGEPFGPILAPPAPRAKPEPFNPKVTG